MVNMMNKEKVINEIVEKLNMTKEDATKVNDVFESHFLIGKNNKEKILADLEKELNISYEEAENIYNNVCETIMTALKNKIKHPFKD